MPSEQSEINISVTGTYPREMPENLREGLAEAIQAHMKGYGCSNVVVRFQMADSLKTISFKVK